MPQKMNLNLTTEHVVQILVGLAGLVGLYVALNVKIAVLETQISDYARLNNDRYDAIHRELDQVGGRLSDINDRISEVDNHIDIVDGRIYEHAQNHMNQ